MGRGSARGGGRRILGHYVPSSQIWRYSRSDYMQGQPMSKFTRGDVAPEMNNIFT